MKCNKVVAVLQAIQDWHSKEKPISELCLLLGDDTNQIGQMLMLNGMADFAYKPMEGFSYQAVVNAITLFLSMRGTLDFKTKAR